MNEARVNYFLDISSPPEILKWWERVISQQGLKVVSQKMPSWDFPGGPVVKTSPSSAGGAGLIPGQGAKIPHAL